MAPERVAFLGIGSMGKAMTKNIVLKANLGSPIVLWNRTAAAAREHAVTLGGESKAVVVESVREAAAHADVVWSCLKDDAAVSEVYEQLYAQDVKGKLFIDSSSIPGPLSNDLAQRAIDAGAEFVSMPVFGDPGLATIGKLICVPAGAAASIHRTAPYTLDVIAKAVVPLNDQQPGDASTIKLIGNTLIMSAMESIAEALVFAEKTGVGAKSMQSLIQTLFPLPPHSVYLQKMMSGEYCGSAPIVNIPMARAMTTKVLGIAKKVGAAVPAYEVAIKHLADVEEQEGPNNDLTAIYGAVRMASGLPFRI